MRETLDRHQLAEKDVQEPEATVQEDEDYQTAAEDNAAEVPVAETFVAEWDQETEELTKHNHKCMHAYLHYRGLMTHCVEQIST